jgi:hypothetical protein
VICSLFWEKNYSSPEQLVLGSTSPISVFQILLKRLPVLHIDLFSIKSV